MKIRPLDRRSLAIVLVLGIAAAVTACGSKQEEPAAAATPAAPPAPVAAPAEPAAVAAPVTASDVANRTWTPEALEDLLAPVALYPDPVLSQVLIASTNPQEVLDAGNWLVANEALKGKALDDGAAQAGFTPPIRALVQFPQTVDQMCMELGWTTELGEAFVADQAGVLGAVQRLRKQAIDVGNLQTSPAMLVETQQQEGQEVVVLKPPKPDVVYVPTYDPQTAYAPASVPQTTTVTPVETDKKYTTGNMVTTGVLAFGAGILVNELFDDDNNNKNKNNGYYYPNYGYGGMPYYPPYPYRPSYGGGRYPSNNYNRPPNYNNGGFQNNGNIIVNPGGGGNGGYWDRYPNRPGSGYNGNNNYKGNNNNNRQARNVSSPITRANPKRNDLTQLNQRQPRPMPADVKRPSPNATAANWKGQQSYSGKNKNKGPNANMSPQERINSATPSYSRPASNKRPDSKVSPKVSGSYAGMNKANRPSTGGMPTTRDMPNNGNRDMQRPQQKPQQKPVSRDMPKNNVNRDMQRPQAKPMPTGDRGYGSKDMQRPMPSNKPMNRPSPNMNQGGNKGNKGTAMSGAGGNRNAGAASQRGKQSMPQGARSKGGGGGGGKKQGR